MALFALQAAADAGEPRVRLNPWRNWPPAPGFSSPTPPARRRTSPAGGAGRHRTGCAVRRGGCRRGFPCRAAIGAAQGLLQLAGTAGQGAGANGGSAALDGMQGRGAALDIALAELAFELGERSCMSERSAATHGRSAPGCRRNARRYRPAPRPVRPRPLPLPARPWRRSCRDDRAGKAPRRSLSIGFATWSFMPAARRLRRSASEALAVMARIGSPAKRPSARILRVASRPSISGICMSISTASNGTLASSTC